MAEASDLVDSQAGTSHSPSADGESLPKPSSRPDPTKSSLKSVSCRVLDHRWLGTNHIFFYTVYRPLERLGRSKRNDETANHRETMPIQ